MGQDPTQRPFRDNLNVRVVCPDCQEDPPNLVEERSSGDLVCADCGRVLQGNVVDTRSEWRTFTNDDQGNDDPSRVGDAADPLLNGSQLSSEIAFTSNDARTRELTRAQRHLNDDRSNRQLQEAYRSISELATASHLPYTVTTMAQGLYKQIVEGGQLKGKTQDAIVASVIFVACRQCRVSRTFKELTILTKVPKKEIGRTFKLVERFLKESNMKDNAAHTFDNDVNGFDPTANNSGYDPTTSTSPKELCGRFGSALGLPARISLIAGECADVMLTKGILAGRSPLSVAAVALYAMSGFMGQPKTAKEVSNVIGISEGTIRSAWRKSYDQREELIKEEWIAKGGVMENLPQP